VIWCRGPITVVDLDQESVRQSVPLHQHATLRRDYFEALQFGQIPAPLSSPTLDRARPLFPEYAPVCVCVCGGACACACACAWAYVRC
jgi:hypothetical protein